jgi:hypothetical protein
MSDHEIENKSLDEAVKLAKRFEDYTYFVQRVKTKAKSVQKKLR